MKLRENQQIANELKTLFTPTTLINYSLPTTLKGGVGAREKKFQSLAFS
jgi:hypothetical protein